MVRSDLNTYSDIFKQEGTSRRERYGTALDPSGVKLDDRGLADFVLFAQRFTRNVQFVPTDPADDNKNLTWDHLFKDDEVLLSAYIATRESDEVKRVFDKLYKQVQISGRTENLGDLVRLVSDRYDKIGQWYSSSSQDSALHHELEIYIRTVLARDLDRLRVIITYLNDLHKNDAEWTTIPAALYAGEIVCNTPGTSEALFTGSNESERLANVLGSVSKLFESVHNATVSVIRSSREYFETHIYKKQDLAPHVALYVAFIRLFSIQQEALNSIPGRMLDYFYRDVLRIPLRGPVADETFVLFELAKGQRQHLLQAGTRVLAGKDDRNRDLVYDTTREVMLSQARVGSLRSVRIDRSGDLIRGYHHNLLRQGADFPAAIDTNAGGSFPLFGERGRAALANTGFAIASSQLYLGKAERVVSLMFETMEPLGAMTYEPTFLELKLTGEKGWMGTHLPDGNADPTVSILHLKKINPLALELRFRISIAQSSAVVAWDEAVHGGAFLTDLPVVQILLSYPDARSTGPGDADIVQEQIEQINQLLKLRIRKTIMQVEVGTIEQINPSFDGIRDLILENHDGPLDSRKPFFPFTAAPKAGSSFYVGNADLFHKTIDALSLNIEWMLPDNFRSHYDRYFPPYDANRFLATVSILKDHFWSKVDDYSIIEKKADDPKARVIAMDQAAMTAKTESELSKSDTSRANGTIKFKLNYPDFGHEVYPQLVTSVALEKSRSGNTDLYKILRKELHDSVITVKIPQLGDPGYRIDKVVELASKPGSGDDAVRNSITIHLNESLSGSNGASRVQPRELREMTIEQTRNLVNDDSFVARVFAFLRRVKLIDRRLLFDRDKQTIDDVVQQVNDELLPNIDFILPADQEMVSVILGEVNHAIERVVSKTTSLLMTTRESRPLDESIVTEVLVKEVADANEVINEMVARKITTLLLVNDIPPAPYTPLINAISLSYRSYKELNGNDDQFFHVLPFGTLRRNLFDSVRDGRTGQDAALFPSDLVSVNPGEAGPGGLFIIGLADSTPGETVSLLFRFDQTARGSAETAAPVHWWFMSSGGWQPFTPGQLVSDGTWGLQTSGLIEVRLPGSVAPQSIFRDGCTAWICASVDQPVDRFPGLINVDAQAVQVRSQPSETKSRQLASQLPAGRLNRLADDIPAVRKVWQPLPSVNGRAAEKQDEYYVRVSERLRHRGRAINNWDYERIILQQFPAVYKVKCLNNYHDGQSIPGHVSVIPLMSGTSRGGRPASFRLPMASPVELAEMKQYLERIAPAFVRIHVLNPIPNYIRVDCRLRLRPDADPGYHLEVLNRDLIAYLTPWLTDPDEPSFSTKVYASSVVGFLHQQHYVDFVADCQLNQYTLTADGEEVYDRLPSKSISLVETQMQNGQGILVSAAQHQIELI